VFIPEFLSLPDVALAKSGAVKNIRDPELRQKENASHPNSDKHRSVTQGGSRGGRIYLLKWLKTGKALSYHAAEDPQRGRYQRCPYPDRNSLTVSIVVPFLVQAAQQRFVYWVIRLPFTRWANHSSMFPPLSPGFGPLGPYPFMAIGHNIKLIQGCKWLKTSL
jgi:hypothetical protein